MSRAALAVVFSDRCARSFIQECTSSWDDGVIVYFVNPQAEVHPVRGPAAEALGAIPAEHVIFVGIPQLWAEDRIGGISPPYATDFLHARKRFVKVTSTIDVRQAVDTVRKRHKENAAAVETALAKQEQEQLEVYAPGPGKEPPWFIPPMLQGGF